MPEHTLIHQPITPAIVRAQFPALAGETVYLENAGGSQVPGIVADSMRRYMLESYVQLGAGYEIANRCDAVINGAHEFINLFMNGTGAGRVILGPSSTQLITMLAACYAQVLQPGDDVDLFLRPEAMLIQPDPSLTDLNRFEVIVKDILFDGANSRLLAHPLDADTELLVALPQNRQFDYIKVNDKIEIGWDQMSGICFAREKKPS